MGTSNHTRRDFLKALGLGAASLVTPGCASTSQMPGAQKKRPNVLFFFTDDQRFDTIHALGNKEIITPNMDYLVRSGTTFTNAYIMGSMSGAVCVPSRAMLMSGRTLFRLKGTGGSIPASHKTLPEVLREAGYETFVTGKWHQDWDALKRGFSKGDNIYKGGMTNNHFAAKFHHYDPVAGTVSSFTADKHTSEMIADAAIEFLSQHRDGSKPFFAYLSFLAPHDPRTAPREYHELYKADRLTVPKNFMPEHPFNNGEMRIRDEKLAAWPRTRKEVRKHIGDYYAMITHADAQMGRVLAALKERGKAENTIIVFAGDNGLAVGRHGLLGKQNLYEHSVHVPLVISGPGIGKGQKCGGFCYLLDIFPTLCELLGLSIPSSVEGESLAGIIRGRKRKIRETLFFAYKDIHRGVCDERYKLIEYNVKGKRTTQVFDLQTDPWELNNLVDSPKHAKRLKRLRKELLRWKEELDDGSKFWQGYDAFL